MTPSVVTSKRFWERKFHKKLVTLNCFIWFYLRIAPGLFSEGGGGRGQEQVARPCISLQAAQAEERDSCLEVAHH